jgi:Pyruvate/2-oxoacid:ferredoxin oxidoreductase delta subunit
LEHGEGKTWYLQAKNYSDDLLRDVRRRRYVEEFLSDPDGLERSMKRLDRLAQAPRFVRSLVGRLVSRRMKRLHFGQVVPIEELETILGFVGSIVRVACLCRQVTLRQERRYCYGVSLRPDGGAMADILRGLDKSFVAGPDARGLETLGRAEALEAIRGHEQEGLCHTVWTFRAPFIGGICNCDRSDCLALRCTVTHGIPVMFRAEYVAAVHPDLCSGCRECLRVCQFGALSYSAATRKAAIDQRWCDGCGICRSACAKDAIRLTDRGTNPVAASL